MVLLAGAALALGGCVVAPGYGYYDDPSPYPAYRRYDPPPRYYAPPPPYRPYRYRSWW
jgi:hypothetical protein